MSTEMFLLDWILTIYAKSLPLDISSRIWDVYILEGDAFLFRTAVAIFRVLRKQILDVDLGGIRKVFGSLCDNVRRCIISRCICGVSYRFSYFYDSSGAGKKRKSCSIKYTASS
jgi:hypothetical protein